MLTVLIHQLVHWLDSSFVSNTHEAERNIPSSVQRITSEAEQQEAAACAIVHRPSADSDAQSVPEVLDIELGIPSEQQQSTELTINDFEVPQQLVSPSSPGTAETSGAADHDSTPETTQHSESAVPADQLPSGHAVAGAAAQADSPSGPSAHAAGADAALQGPPQPGEAQKRALTRTGMITALAIGLHNFPEGLATFVAALVSCAG